MKLLYVISNEIYMPRVMEILKKLEIDYYTEWDEVKGKGHGTDPHLGTRSFPSMNSVLMIAFDDETIVEKLVDEIVEANSGILKPDDRIRMFQVPLERIV
jgi:Nitrogen regulatory protein P-II